MTSPPLGLYVHFPWCERKCPYCDFNSHAARGAVPERAYVDCLLADLDAQLDATTGRPIVSVFFGGGTPSLIDPAQVGRIVDALRARGRLAADAEVTLEANPGSAERARFAGYRRAGINRLSIGVQSFDDRSLRALGRIHDGASARRAVADARDAGFERLNLDLMFGLPDQTVASAVRDIELACQLDPGHISHYQLTLEPGTVFYRYRPQLPAEESILAMLGACTRRLSDSGYRRYEVSALARPGHRCRHNLNYWLYGDYLGIGAGAHGKQSDATGIWRTSHPRSPALYQQAINAGQTARRQHCTAQDAAFEFMLNALRLRCGFPAALFEVRTGQPLAALGPTLAIAQDRGLLMADDDWICPTPLGARFLNDLQALFLPATGDAAATPAALAL